AVCVLDTLEPNTTTPSTSAFVAPILIAIVLDSPELTIIFLTSVSYPRLEQVRVYVPGRRLVILKFPSTSVDEYIRVGPSSCISTSAGSLAVVSVTWPLIVEDCATATA